MDPPLYGSASISQSLNFSQFVAHKPWLRRRASPLHCRAHTTKIGELFDAPSCSDTPTSIYCKLLEIERPRLPRIRLCTKSPVRNLTRRSIRAFWSHSGCLSRPESSNLAIKSTAMEHFLCKAPVSLTCREWAVAGSGLSGLHAPPGRDPYADQENTRPGAHRSCPSSVRVNTKGLSGDRHKSKKA